MRKSGVGISSLQRRAAAAALLAVAAAGCSGSQTSTRHVSRPRQPVGSVPFKATAGLHHPVRAPQALTYEADSPRALMHGFLNVLLAGTFAWHGERDIEPILAETEPQAFRFDPRLARGS